MVALRCDMAGDHPCAACSGVVEHARCGWAGRRPREWELRRRCWITQALGKDRLAFEAELHDALEAATQISFVSLGLCGFLSPEFTARWAGKMLNIHPSLLPKYRGLHTHARAIEAGDVEHGCTVHEVTAELDGGPILGQARVQLQPATRPTTLAAKVLPFEHQLYPAVLRRFAAGDADTLCCLGCNPFICSVSLMRERL